MTHQLFSLALALTLGTLGTPSPSPQRIEYTVRVDSAQLSGITVDMRIVGAPADFRVAMVAHTEYDDEYWRYLTDLRGESSHGTVRIAREDSSLWRVSGPSGDITLHYRVRFPDAPPTQQASWKAHLIATGGLVGGPHSFLYVVGGEHAPVTVSVHVPQPWAIVTGLRATGSHTYSASGTEELVDSPMLVGLIRDWRFDVNGVPHHIAFLGHSGGVAFDTTLFISNVERLARETVRMFGNMPYREYQFLFEDGTYGGLEHVNSVSIGTQSTNLARDPNSYLGQIAHEFFHTWNEVHVRPMSWIGVRRAAPTPTGELWWSEGVTLYFADLILRRAGLYAQDSSRVAHLERYITNYLANPSHGMVSPEATSKAFNMPAEATGDLTPSMFTQGELIGSMLDLMIRDDSKGKRSLDDAMRSMSERFSIERGFTGADVERAVSDACSCDAQPFFAAYVRNAGALDFDKWLALVGMRTAVSWSPARLPDGSAAPDLRVSASSAPGDSLLHLRIWFPATVWGRAGLHSGDRVVALNDVAMRDASQFRATLAQVHIGDTVRLELLRDGVRFDKAIALVGYERPTVHIETRTDAADAQRRLFVQWSAGR